MSKFIGIGLGIALANCIQGSTPLALVSFGVVTWIHMFCNLKSYQAIQLRTLNPYRASNPFCLYLYFIHFVVMESILQFDPIWAPLLCVFNVEASYRTRMGLFRDALKF